MNLLQKYFNLKQSLAESTDHPMIEHNGNMLHRNNSDGKPIHHTDEGIKNFHNWFGDSKMTDKHGRPQTFYHGTSEDFSKFSKDTANKNTKTGVPENTHFFSDDAAAASSYAKQKTDRSTKTTSWGEGGNVKPVYIKAKKVLKIDAKGDDWNNISYKAKGDHNAGDYDMNDLSQIAKHGKYHAMLVKNVHDRQDYHGSRPATSVAVFTHNQVKSVFNNGKWDKDSDKISEDTYE